MPHAYTLLLLGCTVGCAAPRSVVPVTGHTEILAGDWSGQYMSAATGRSGAIQFRLKAGTDSAWGEVIMIAANNEVTKENLPMPPDPTMIPLSIAFVSCQDGGVIGGLAPYYDPVTGETVETTFEGRLVNQREFSGKFFSHYPMSRRFITGTWSVQRMDGARRE